MGFGVPVGTWLRGALREWAETLLDERRLYCEGFFDPVPIRQKWSEHLSGKCNWQYWLWDILMFQAWLDETSRTERSKVESPGKLACCESSTFSRSDGGLQQG
jgi:asparagine synthase (glutamine-hydrolysing)